MKYYVVFERADDGGWCAYPPDLPGVGIAARTQGEARESIRKAIEMHVAALIADGLPVPEPSGEYVEVS